jgi:hypothetical protein
MLIIHRDTEKVCADDLPDELLSIASFSTENGAKGRIKTVEY